VRQRSASRCEYDPGSAEHEFHDRAQLVGIAAISAGRSFVHERSIRRSHEVVAAYHDGDWHGTDPLQVVRMAYLLGVIANAATNAVAAVDQFHAAAADQQPATAGDQW
jgi:hypothetical protein